MVSVLLDQVSKRYGNEWVLRNVSLRVEQGEAVVLLGPTGSGKTTILRLIAGLDEPTTGDILFNGEPAKEAPNERNVAMLFADNRLNPRMSARTNIEFPLKVRRTPEPERTYRVEAEAGALGIRGLLDRMPDTLSAGQASLVHMAKAMVRAPGVFLVDEPLGAVDTGVRRELRMELRRIQQGYGATAIYATNDQEDAMVLGDRLAVLDDMRIIQSDSPQDVYNRPINRSVATFIGNPEMSILTGRRHPGGVAIGDLTLVGPTRIPETVHVGVRPERWRTGAGGLEGRVTAIDDIGSDVYVTLQTVAGEVTMRWTDAIPESGDVVSLTPESYHLFEPVTGRCLHHST